MADGTLRWTVVPGRLLEHLTHFGVAPRGALFVGALNIDEEAARLAGIAFLRAQDFFGA